MFSHRSTGIIICSRSNSVRVPNKPFVKVNGVPILIHLIKRLIPTKLPIFIAVPHCDYDLYNRMLAPIRCPQLHLVAGSASDPLARMNTVAQKYELSQVVRICHDKIFVDPDLINHCLEIFHNSDLDYLYSSKFIDGSGFEIIASHSLALASEKFKDVEHVGYAIKCVTDRVSNLGSIEPHPIPHRLLIDYPEDVKLMELIISLLGNDCSLKEVLHFLDQNPWVSRLNQLPLVTVYTCAYNSDKWLGQCMGSVSSQDDFRKYEYLLIDDASIDNTNYLMAQFCSIYSNAEWIKNEKNQGLSSSSNIALARARGKYIIRLDADDHFSSNSSIKYLVNAIESTQLDVIYPDNYYGNLTTIQKGSEYHHVGGAIFRTRAANHIRFTDGLRGYEGYDFFSRAQGQLKIGYLSKPVFFYRQHKNSMSKTNLEMRKTIKDKIDYETQHRLKPGFT
jgi:spore coat polysaccharide biosynthesis protein SpsF (cytidylyltransferase family)